MLKRVMSGLAALADALALGVLAFGVLTLSAAASAQPTAPAPDYAQASAWVCRPGKEAVCTTGLSAMAITAEGERTPAVFTPAANPPVDCFYIYPTASEEQTPYSDMAETPEVERIVKGQAGRLSSQCRVFAPLYRQLTLAGMHQDMASGAQLDWRAPYRDVLAAWRQYLAHDNGGRGVVLVGHSQGTILLQRLIAEEIDGRPVQRLLVSAFLAGDPSFAVARDRRVGGTFKSIPLCAAADQTGCAYVWGSYLSDDASADRQFGSHPDGGLAAGCASPAAPAGGSGKLEAFLPRPSFAPADDPPWIELLGQLSAACVSDAQGAVLRITIEPGRYAPLLQAALAPRSRLTGWGLHPLDVNLVQGNMVDLIGLQSRRWPGR